jgi:hypothetical protein
VDATDIKWNDFKQAVELHRSYLELAMKLNMFYYAITGAILSFYFTHNHIPMAKFALGLPIVLSAALAVVFLWSAFMAQRLRMHIRNTAAELGLATAPEGVVLVMICVIFGAMLTLVFLGLLWFFINA